MTDKSKPLTSDVGNGFFIMGFVLAEFSPKFDLMEALTEAGEFVKSCGEEKTALAITTVASDVLGESCSMYVVRVYRRDHTLTTPETQRLMLMLTGIDPDSLPPKK